MKKILLSAPIIFFLLTLGFLYRGLENDPKHLPSALIGKNIPTFELRTLDAENVLTPELSKRGVKIIGLNYKDQESLAGDWLDDKGDPYIFSIFDPDGKLGFDLGVYGAPETYLVDAYGIIMHKRVGVLDERIWQNEFKDKYYALENAIK